MRDLLLTPDPSELKKSRSIALVVDRDATSRRFAELALGRVGFSVETARDAAGAFETLKLELIDLIVCDTELDDMDGLTFFRRLSREHRLRSIPFMFLSADPGAGSKVRALRAGADDYLVKPCDVSEFVARAEALVERQRRARETARSRTFSLAGDLSVVPFADTIALLEMTRRCGILSLFTPGATGLLHFEHGRVVHARYGNLGGEEAFFRLFREQAGHFEFALTLVAPEERTIHSSASALILEAARLHDTEVKNRPRRTIPSSGNPSDRSPVHSAHLPGSLNPSDRSPVRSAHLPGSLNQTHRLVQQVPLMPPLDPDHTVRAHFETAIEDAFALGELCVWTGENLCEWTRSEGGSERFHVHLVADLENGMSSMLALAGAPSERWIFDTMTAEAKAFGLEFRLRRDRVLDVLLIDAKDPTAHLDSMERVPSVMLICPPEGGLLALGSNARVGLELLIETLAPPVVVGVGNDALSTGLAQLRPFREGSLLHCISADPRDLRSLLVEGIRLWARAIPLSP